ncbi:hypothetical protein ACWD5A_21725, partial [Streptomyces sp. NPDC002491]
MPPPSPSQASPTPPTTTGGPPSAGDRLVPHIQGSAAELPPRAEQLASSRLDTDQRRTAPIAHSGPDGRAASAPPRNEPSPHA